MPDGGGERWQVDDLIIDVGGQVVLRGNETIPLPKHSFNFLLALVHAAPNVVSVDELMSRVWIGVFVSGETVTQRAKLLRDALGDDPRKPRYFTVRRGTGYQLLPLPRSLPAALRAAESRNRRGSNWKAAFAALLLLAVLGGAGIVAERSWFDKPAALKSPRSSGNPEARLAYLKGMSLLGRYSVKESEEAAIQFQRAVRLDADQAPALAALFDARMQSADLRKESLEQVRVKYRPLLDKALELQPDSGPVLFVQAMWADTTQEQRLKLYRRAIELDPNNTRGLLAFVEFLERSAGPSQGAGSAGSEGRALLNRVLAVDPLNPRARWWAAQRKLGRNGGAARLEVELRSLLQLDPDFYLVAQRYARYRWMVDGQTAEAIERTKKLIATDPENPLGPYHAAVYYLDVGEPEAARVIAATTPASRDAARMLLAQYAGDWRTAGEVALSPRGFLFNQFENWNWSEAVRDYALRTRQYDRAIAVISKRFDLDADDPHVTYLAQIHAAPALAHILLAKGNRAAASRLLNQTIEWIDANYQYYGPTGLLRYRAESAMLLGDTNRALQDFRSSIVLAHDIRQWWYEIDQDPIWESLRHTREFREIAAYCGRAASVERKRLDYVSNRERAPIQISG